ncbi:MAG: hypothetical protein JST64_01140 [Actinobacteria bacterium]|nr:hypothetical protein [Actinomycetota bacterium]
MKDSAYIAAAWIGSFGAVGLYAAALIARGRRLSKVVPQDRRRWMSEGSAPRRRP